jgi:hypothetical protein
LKRGKERSHESRWLLQRLTGPVWQGEEAETNRPWNLLAEHKNNGVSYFSGGG